MSVRGGFERKIPGRIIGASVDSQKKQAFRMALQVFPYCREQVPSHRFVFPWHQHWWTTRKRMCNNYKCQLCIAERPNAASFVSVVGSPPNPQNRVQNESTKHQRSEQNPPKEKHAKNRNACWNLGCVGWRVDLFCSFRGMSHILH